MTQLLEAKKKIRSLAIIALSWSFLSGIAQAQLAPLIVLPDLLAVELPAGATGLGPADPPLRDLLADAKSGARPVTADLPDRLTCPDARTVA